MNRVIRNRLRRSVMLTTKSKATFTGVLVEADRHAVVLRNAAAVGHGEGGAPLPLDGEVLILTADIDFVQIIGGV